MGLGRTGRSGYARGGSRVVSTRRVRQVGRVSTAVRGRRVSRSGGGGGFSKPKPSYSKVKPGEFEGMKAKELIAALKKKGVPVSEAKQAIIRGSVEQQRREARLTGKSLGTIRREVGLPEKPSKEELVKAAEVKKKEEKKVEVKEGEERITVRSGRQIEKERETKREEEFRQVTTLRAAPKLETKLEKAEMFFEKQRQKEGLTPILGGFGGALVGTARSIKMFATKPVSTTKAVGGSLLTTGKRFVKGETFPSVGKLLYEEPKYVAGAALAEFFTMKGTGVATKGLGKLGTKVTTRLSPKFKPVKTVKGKPVVTLKDTSKFDVELLKPGLQKIEEPVSQQVKMSGQLTRPVTAQRDLFGKVTRRKLTVEKPLPTPDSPQLERALFADPRGRLRVSRLGIEDVPEAGVLDILSGDVTFRSTKPQAIVFPEQRIAKFPKSLKDVESKLRRGKTLTPSEARRLEKFQLKPSGEFKPVGFISREPEITLAPGEVIRRKRVLGVTEISGRRVPFIQAEVAKPSPKLARMIAEGVTDDKAGKFVRAYRRETGISIRPRPSGAFVSPRRVGVSGAVAVSSLVRPSSKIKAPKSVSPGISKPVSRPSPTPRTISLSPVPSPIVRPRRQEVPKRITRPVSSAPSPVRPVSPISRPPSVSPISPTPSISPSPMISPISRPPKTPPKIPETKDDEPFKPSKYLRKKGKQAFAYNIDFTSYVLGEVGAAPKKVKGVTFTGFEARPLTQKLAKKLKNVMRF